MPAGNFEKAMVQFFLEDIGGNLVTGENGEILYEDRKTAFIRNGKTNWKAACPPAAPGQKAETWDLLHYDSGTTHMVITSTFKDDEGMKQIHHLVDTSTYMELFRDISNYSKSLKTEKEHDGLTGLYNKGKLMELKKSLFRKQETIAVYNMDVNNLKEMNDNYGHEAGDKLILKAAESLKMIEARNIMPFRVGGDEFIVVAIHVNRGEAEAILERWKEGLNELNKRDDGIQCVIAVGFDFGEKGHDMDTVFAKADQRMYEDKREKKLKAGQPLTRR